MGANVRSVLAALSLAAAIGVAGTAHAQFSLPTTAQAAPNPESLFRNQCGACHTLSPTDGPRQGPPLAGVIGRHAGRADGFKYSADLAGADFTWDEQRLDAWLTNPQEVLPSAQMAYRQANPATRRMIIQWLKEQH